MLVYDHNQLAAPELLIPRAKPVGSVIVNQEKFSAPVRWVIFPEQKHGVIGGRSTAVFLSNASETYNYPKVVDSNLGMYFSRVNDDVQFTASTAMSINQSFCLLVDFFLTQTPAGAYQFIWGANGTSYFSVAPRHATASYYLMSSVAGVIASSGVSCGIGRYTVLVRRAIDKVSIFLNGVKTAASATSGGACGGTIAVFNAYAPATGTGLPGPVVFMSAIFDGALSDSECLSLTLDPYSMLQAI